MKPALQHEIKNLKQGDDACAICENEAEQTPLGVHFMMEGLKQNERCLYVMSDQKMKDAVQMLNAHGVDVTREIERGSLLLSSNPEAFCCSRNAGSRGMAEFLSRTEAAALQGGFTGTRFLIDMAWLSDAQTDRSPSNEHELLLDAFPTLNRSIILCQYDRSRCDPGWIEAALRSKRVAIVADLVCPNQFYVPPVVRDESAVVERVEWKLAQLQQARLAENAHRQEHSILRAVFEGVTDALFVKDLQGRYLIINTAGAKFLGKSVNEVLGKDDTELFTPETGRTLMEDDRRIMATGAIEIHEDAVTAAGVTRIFLSTKGPYRDELGNIGGIIGIARDVTDSRRVQAERDHLTERLILQADRLPIAYILMDANYRILDWNPAAEKIFGYTKKEALGQSCVEILHSGPLSEQLQQVLRQIQAGDMQSHSINDNRKKDGTTITCDWFNTPLVDAAGKLTGIISLAQDISWRNRVESQLNENRRFFQAIFENALDPILVFNDLGRFLDGNPAASELLGQTKAEMLGMDVWDVTATERQESIPGLLGRFFSAGSQIDECTIISKNGAIREFEYRAVANILPGLHMAILREITERKLAEKAMQKYSKSLERLTRRVIEIQEEERRHLARELHDELGQILSMVNVNLRAVREANIHWRLDDSIQIVDGAIEQVRNLSLDLRPTMLDDLGLISTLRWYADRQAQAAGFLLHFGAKSTGTTLPPHLSIACYRVAQESLTNVLRHARAKHVWIEYQQTNEIVHLIIRDDGLGFDLSQVRQRSVRQATVGLLAIQERVELLGGKFDIESQPGKGTTIQVNFPIMFSEDHRPLTENLVPTLVPPDQSPVL